MMKYINSDGSSNSNSKWWWYIERKNISHPSTSTRNNSIEKKFKDSVVRIEFERPWPKFGKQHNSQLFETTKPKKKILRQNDDDDDDGLMGVLNIE